MKFLFAIGVIALVATQLSAKNLPSNKQAPRSFGNFGPTLKKSFHVYKPQERIMFKIDPVAAAVQFFVQKANLVGQPEVASFHTSGHNGVTHVYLQQIINGVQVVNGVGNVNVGKHGEILSFGSSFFQGLAPASGLLPKHTVQDAVEALAELVRESGELRKETPPALKYIQIQDGNELALVWDIVVETKQSMYNAIVDTSSNEVVQLIDWVSDASYNVYPLGINDPNSGDRVLLEDPAVPAASPLGWHAQSETETFTNTIGNNVYAQENLDGGSEYVNNYRPEGNTDLTFDFPIDFSQQPGEYLDAAITNLFYWNNIIHDLFYAYGFNEESGNFQQNNFGLGGEGGDAVIAHAQDGSGLNNANFLTPPDGTSGRMRMYVWVNTSPARDGDLDGGIVMHEYLHGISNRLTGGPTNVGCLGFGEDGGMGEGWGDTFATITRVTVNGSRLDDYQMGDYSNGGSGIRNYPYSTNLETNPSTYAFTIRPDYGGVHAKGEVWAVILYEVFWNLVDTLGFDSDWFNNNPETVLRGNVVFFQLLVDGMKLQPCNPTFIEARDAIIEADAINNAGANACDLWRGFAKRGLGTEAVYPGVDSFDLPVECQ